MIKCSIIIQAASIMTIKHTIGIYPGTFDPITNGHIDILLRASKIVDKLIIGISTGYSKTPMFSHNERQIMIESCIEQYDLGSKIEVQAFDGLLVNFAKSSKASLIFRGLRAISDFEYEFQMSCMNSRLEPSIDTIFIPASEKNQFISSKLVKEVASLGGDISSFVTSSVAQRVYKFYAKAK